MNNDKCEFCKGAGKEPGEPGCVWCLNTGTKEGQALLTPPAQQHQGEPVALGIPDECPHIIVFDDADRANEHFCGAGARPAALRRYEQISHSWNAHLFVRIARNSRDDRYPCATVADPAEVERLRDELDGYKQGSRIEAEEADNLRKQLAEAHPLRALGQEAYSTLVGMVEHCLIQRVCMGMDEGFKSFDPEEEHDFVHELREFVALSASAEPSAPVEKIKLYLNVSNVHVTINPDGSYTIDPVEIDERAEFEKWWSSLTSVDPYTKGEHWDAWQARAALERKP